MSIGPAKRCKYGRDDENRTGKGKIENFATLKQTLSAGKKIDQCKKRERLYSRWACLLLAKRQEKRKGEVEE